MSGHLVSERPVRIPASRSAARAVSSGHPWVFREGLIDAPPGQLVELVGPDDAVVGWGLGDEGPIAVRVLGRGPKPDQPLARIIAERIRRADAVRLRLVPPETDAMRIVAAAGDGLPGLVVDRYADLAVLRIYAAAWEPHLELVVKAIAALPWVNSVVRRLGVKRVDGREGTDTLHGPPPPEQIVVHEGGMALLVRPYVGQKTGLFLDQREHRALVGRWSSGRLVTNLFAYTGGFSVSAALGGAARVITVDLAPEAVEDARENFRLNGLDPARHGFEVADVFAWHSKTPVDLLIVDPPSLAHGKKAEQAARSAYKRLHARLGGSVTRDGLLATSSCTSRLALDDWRDAVREGLASTGDWSWHWTSTEPPDHPVALHHPEGRYLKFAVLRRR